MRDHASYNPRIQTAEMEGSGSPCANKETHTFEPNKYIVLGDTCWSRCCTLLLSSNRPNSHPRRHSRSRSPLHHRRPRYHLLRRCRRHPFSRPLDQRLLLLFLCFTPGGIREPATRGSRRCRRTIKIRVAPAQMRRRRGRHGPVRANTVHQLAHDGPNHHILDSLINKSKIFLVLK